MPRGRQIGAKNKPKSAMLRMLQEKYGEDFHPIMELAKIANDMDADLEMKFKANKELAQYVVPKLRQVESKIEHTGELFNEINLNVVANT